jgi:hypothetical protein
LKNRGKPKWKNRKRADEIKLKSMVGAGNKGGLKESK